MARDEQLFSLSSYSTLVRPCQIYLSCHLTTSPSLLRRHCKPSKMGTRYEDKLGSDSLEHGQSGGSKTPTCPEQDSPNQVHRAKAAYYNAASEKSVSHEEAKLFYQRHRLENLLQHKDTGIDGDEVLSRTTSTASWRSGQRLGVKDCTWTPNVSETEANLQPRSSPVSDAQRMGKGKSESTKDEEFGKGRGFIAQDMSHSDISPELTAISKNIKKLLRTRHKYTNLSLQGRHDNPKDRAEWRIYPPPPNPTWDADNARTMNGNDGSGKGYEQRAANGGQSEKQDSMGPSSNSLPKSAKAKARKPGQDIGADFEMANVLPVPGSDDGIRFELDQESVYQIYRDSSEHSHDQPLVQIPSLREFYMDMDGIQNISSDGPTKSFAYRQLDILEGRFHLYSLVNAYQETADSKKVPHRDFYNVRKVDTHVHHSACMNQKHLLRFIKSKMKKSPDEIVMYRDDKELTLKQVFESINLTAYDLSIDTLDMHVSLKSTYFHKLYDFDGICRLTQTHSTDLTNSISSIIRSVSQGSGRFFLKQIIISRGVTWPKSLERSFQT